MHLEELHNVRSFFGGPLHPYKRLLCVTESKVGVEECGRGHVALLRSAAKLVHNLQSRRAATTASVSPGEYPQHARAAIGQRCRFFQCSDRFIELLRTDKREAQAPESHRIGGLFYQLPSQFPNRLVVTPRVEKDPPDPNAVRRQGVEFLRPPGPRQCFLASALAY